MKCKVCGEELQVGQAVIKFEGLEMETPVSVKSGVCFSGGVVHVGCIHELEDVVVRELGKEYGRSSTISSVKHAIVDGKALCAR